MGVMTVTKPELTNLECPSCGGPLLLSPDGVFATCKYCGGTQMLQQATAQFDRLRDYPNAAFGVRHVDPKMTLDQAKGRIINEIKEDPIGYADPEELSMKVDGGFLPMWFIEASGSCFWNGKYSEQRTVTKYRTVQKSRTVPATTLFEGKPTTRTEYYTEQEPYNDIETIWHPTNGAHNFSSAFTVPANESLVGETQFLSSKQEISETESGFPPPIPDHQIQPALVTQRQAWDKGRCLDRIKAQAEAECSDKVEQLEGVAPKVEQVSFSLVFLPYGVTSCAANGREYRRLFNLVDGSCVGDYVPLNHNAVDVGALSRGGRDARTSQDEIDRRVAEGQAEMKRQRYELFREERKWRWGFAAPILFFILSLMARDTFVWVVFWLTAVASTVAYLVVRTKASGLAKKMEREVQSTLPTETPWADFVRGNRVSLLRAMRIACDKAARKDMQERAVAMRHLEREESSESLSSADRFASALVNSGGDGSGEADSSPIATEGEAEAVPPPLPDRA